MNDANGKYPCGGEGAVDAARRDFTSDEQWRQVLRLAWRPAWSIRSRKGCLAPLIRWWKERRHTR